MKRILSILVSIVFLFCCNISVNAHPGRTDKNGCHYCRTNCEKYGLEYNEYHCHNGNSTNSSNNKTNYTNNSINSTSNKNSSTTVKKDDEKDEMSFFEIVLGCLGIYGGSVLFGAKKK